jgi:hypothetical protein
MTMRRVATSKDANPTDASTAQESEQAGSSEQPVSSGTTRL